MRHIGSIRFNEIVVPATKACSILLPIILVTVPFAPILEKHPIASLVIGCTPSKSSSRQHSARRPNTTPLLNARMETVFSCWVVGSLCVVAILIKYVRGLASFSRIEESRSTDISLATSTGQKSQSGVASQTDKWLLLRFLFTFVALR